MDFLTEFDRSLRQPHVAPEVLAIHIAGLAYPDLEPRAIIADLDDLAASMGAHLDDVTPGRMTAHAFMAIFVDGFGFAGNAADYYQPDNSYLNIVLARRTGLPILLSLVCVALGRRLGLAIDGAGFPGHFMVRYRHGEESWLLDPFHGRVLQVDEVQDYLSGLFGQAVSISQQALTGVTAAAFAQRILNNLRNVYLGNQAWAEAVQVLDYMLILLPSSTALLQERALLNYRLGDLERASRDLQRYFSLTGQLWHALDLTGDEQGDASRGYGELIQLFQRIQEERRRLN